MMANMLFAVRSIRFNVRFYLVALFFIVFDVEVIFLYPWAVVFKQLFPHPQLGSIVFWEMIIFLAIPYIVFFNLWPNWGATLYGEVRGATDFKRNFWGMGWALIGTTILGAVVFLLISKTITWDWYMNANGAWWNYRWGYTEQTPPLPIWPYPALLAVFMTPSRILQFIVILAMSAWWFGWSGTVFLSSTRVIFAAAFDLATWKDN